ncbi:hypothetical protein ACQPYK_28595 [Streptosporangium sp. CA-135522]|uniref:hypothetical protein n=1 Tax=Streptosporangium sp. CA-135522 TaxID=3240072 RepID=UPI003D92E038
MAKTLFDSVTVGKLDLPDRLAMAPMTRSRAATGGLSAYPEVLRVTEREAAGIGRH